MSNRKGFTLIELMLVVVIISVLAAAVVGNFVSSGEKAYKARVDADIATFTTMLDMYQLDNGMYPTTEQGLKALYEKPSSAPVPANWAKGGYIKNAPIDPWKGEYKYRYPGQFKKDSYDIWSMGLDGKDGTEDDIGNWQKQSP